jgi:hypothetical protein
MATTTDSLKNFSNKALTTSESFLSKSMSVFGNKYLKNFALVLLLLYAPAAAPSISPAVAGLLQNYAIKLIYVFVFAYLLSESIRVSIVTSVVIVLGIFLLKKFGSEHFEGEIIENNNLKEIPSEPVINRAELTKAKLTKAECNVAENIEANALNNITEYNAMANHSDALQPEYLQEIKQVETDTSISGYDESLSVNSSY